MKDVTTLAQVSLSTVSRFVNGDPGRPDLAARISQAIDLLEHQCDLTASTLRRADRASASIGVLVPDVGNPFFAAVLRGIEEIARARRSLIAASSDEDPAREKELAMALTARRIDGLIVVPAGGDSWVPARRPPGPPAAGVRGPAATLPRRRHPCSATTPEVLLPPLAYCSTAATPRIAFLGHHERVFTNFERLRGHREALAAAGVAADPALVRLCLDQDTVEPRGPGPAGFARTARPRYCLPKTN
jgi:LacI family transcriptional regulator